MYTYKTKITNVYDGDTFTCDIDLGFYTTLRHQKLRLLGVDTPELRGDERELGLISKQFVEDNILGKTVTLTTTKNRRGDEHKGSFGRWLGKIEYIDDSGNSHDLSTQLLDLGLAVTYE